MQIYTWSEQVYICTGVVYLHMCKLTFTYMQLRSYAQKYTRVQIIHMYNLHTVCKSAHVNGAIDYLNTKL